MEFDIITWNLTEVMFQIFIFMHNIGIGHAKVASLHDYIE